MENIFQTLTVDDQKRLSLSGVISVDGFTDEKIRLVAKTGRIAISGEKLKINNFSETTGTFACEGKILSITYLAPREGIVKRLFK